MSVRARELSVPALLGRHAADSVVAWGPDGEVTTLSLLEHVRGFQALLGAAEPGQEIIVICRDRYRFAVATLAAWSAGYSVALPPNAQPATIGALRGRPCVATVVHDVDGVEKGIDVRDAAVVHEVRAGAGRVEFRSPAIPLDPERRIATVFTGGSTGDHVACGKSARQLLGEAGLLARTFAETFSLPGGARVAPMVPPHHIYGLLFGVLVPLVSGGAFCRRTPLHAAEVGDTLRGAGGARGGADVLVTVPAHLRGLMVAAPSELPNVARVFSSAAPLAPRVAEAMRERFGWTITEVFGSTETGGIGWRQTGGAGPWTPFAGVQVQSAEDGTLALASPLLPADAPAPYRAADRVTVSPDGRFEHHGRADGILKIGGVRVSLQEVERRILAIDGVGDAAVLAAEVPGARGHEVWAAYVAPEVDERAVRAALRLWLAPVALPRRLRRVAALPREESGKLPRRALLALFGKRRDGES